MARTQILAPVVQKVDSAIGSPNIYPLDSDLSGWLRFPAFEQLGPGIQVGAQNKDFGVVSQTD